MQADVLELRVLHLVGNKKSIETLKSMLSIGSLKGHPPQRHTSSNKAISTRAKPHLLTVRLPIKLCRPINYIHTITLTFTL